MNNSPGSVFKARIEAISRSRKDERKAVENAPLRVAHEKSVL
jgi:hypothetical protein